MRAKFDYEKLPKFEDYVAMGMTKENSAIMAFDIDRATFYRWYSEESTLSAKKHRDLVHAYENGRSRLNNRLALYILKGAEVDGKLALDFMKRLEPDAYGDSSKVVGDKDNPLKVVHEGVIVMPPLDSEPMKDAGKKLLRPETKGEDLPAK